MKIQEEITSFIMYGPVRHKDKKWDLLLVTLDHNGQKIDISGGSTTKIFNDEKQEWMHSPTNYSLSRKMIFQGMTIPVIDPYELVEYKKLLEGNHQKEDIKAVEAYIKSQSLTLFKNIKALLDQHGITYEEKHHVPTKTSEESAAARGEPLKIGAKALLVKAKDEFVLCIIPADKRLDTKKVKETLKSKDLRFADEEELKKVTGCVKGAVPPFGHLLGVKMIVDKTLFEEENMAFNAGSLEHSIKMKTKDYRNLTPPEEVDII